MLSLLFSALLALATPAPDTIAADAAPEPAPRRPITLPGAGHINVETLRDFDLDMDISRLSLAELRVLRNAIAARQGYAFQSEDLRSLFSTTSWYDSLMLARWERVEESFEQHPVNWEALGDEDYRVTYARQHDKYVPLQYTAAEQRFVVRVCQREALLAQQNFAAQPPRRVNVDNILNPWQLEDFPETLRDALGRNGFAIVPADGLQLFHIYEQNDYTVFPSFVTTDVYLQLFHFYFDCVLRDIEQQRLDSCVSLLCSRLNAGLDAIARQPDNKIVANTAQWLQAYFAVARALHSGQRPAGAPPAYAADAAAEVERCLQAQNDFSPFLGYVKAQFPYALFRPRGHYAANERLQRYFRTMMWLQTASFATDDAQQMQRAALLAHVLRSDTATLALYHRITEPLTYLLGAPDNASLMQLAELLPTTDMGRLLTTKSQMQRLTAAIEDVAERQTRIRPKHLLTARHKLNLMPQRYMPDAEVLQEMADDETMPTSLRPAPRALDVMAAMGVGAAERILIDVQREADRWPQYPLRLDSMRRRMAAIDWPATVATTRLDALRQLPTPASGQPYFMLTPEWQRKCLNTALASYAELKHDAILYAKQPFGAECGGAGPPEPLIKGYVEPSLAFWQKAVELNTRFVEVLERYDLFTDKAQTTSEAIGTLAQFLLEVTRKELAGQPLTMAEHDQIEVIGATIENISLDLARAPEQWLQNWDDVLGADRSVACIADVYTANSLNIPEDQKAVLYEAVGAANELYVVVEVEGQLWLMRGAVLSYRELERPLSMPRLTDEEWQQHLLTDPDDGTPAWMQDIIVPLKERPKPNAEVFYSTGC